MSLGKPQSLFEPLKNRNLCEPSEEFKFDKFMSEDEEEEKK